MLTHSQWPLWPFASLPLLVRDRNWHGTRLPSTGKGLREHASAPSRVNLNSKPCSFYPHLEMYSHCFCFHGSIQELKKAILDDLVTLGKESGLYSFEQVTVIFPTPIISLCIVTRWPWPRLSPLWCGPLGGYILTDSWRPVSSQLQLPAPELK